MRETILHDRHVALGARMAPFAGFIMPIQYIGIIPEHEATRTHATLFDTCHMGEFLIRGKSAVTDLERILTCRAGATGIGRCRYGMMCNDKGGVIDDLIIYRQADDEFMLVVNAGTREHDFAWLSAHISATTELCDISESTAKIDLQGPFAPRLAVKLLGKSVQDLAFHSFMRNHFRGEPVLVSRSGYTGEIGFEFYGTAEVIRGLWDACLQAGATSAGLGARDTLRLEMGLPLYGHELCEERNAAQAGFSGAIDTTKEFIGATAIKQYPEQKLCGIRIDGRRAARQGDPVFCDGIQIGEVTSGSFAPSLQAPVALAYVNTASVAEGTALIIRHDEREMNGTVVSTPFYKNGTAKRAMDDFI